MSREKMKRLIWPLHFAEGIHGSSCSQVLPGSLGFNVLDCSRMWDELDEAAGWLIFWTGFLKPIHRISQGYCPVFWSTGGRVNRTGMLIGMHLSL